MENKQFPPISGPLALALLLGVLPMLDAAETTSPKPSPPRRVITGEDGLPPLRPTPQQSTQSAMTNMPLKVISPGVFQLGEVRLDHRERTVTFPAVLNMKDGPMEYFLVAGYGKTHESILRTDAQTFHIHVAMLLLGVQGSDTNQSSARALSNLTSVAQSPAPSSASEPVSNPGNETLRGDKIAIEISWKADGKEVRRPAEELVFNQQTRRAMQAGNWIYNGSKMADGIFQAQAGGSVISLITDSTALVNNTSPGHDNDSIWTVNTNQLPAMNAALQVTFRVGK